METVLVASVAGQQNHGAMSATQRMSVPSGGVNAALFEYGDFLLERHSKQRAVGNHTTEVEYLGYGGTAYYFCE